MNSDQDQQTKFKYQCRLLNRKNSIFESKKAREGRKCLVNEFLSAKTVSYILFTCLHLGLGLILLRIITKHNIVMGNFPAPALSVYDVVSSYNYLQTSQVLCFIFYFKTFQTPSIEN